MSSLNSMEEKVLIELYQSSDGNGHDFGFTDDVDTVKLGITRRQLSGYISQLSQKDYINVFDNEFNQFEFTEKGFKYFENRR